MFKSNELFKSDVTVTRYGIGRCWVDIVEDADTYEAWIQGVDYGVSHLMFGVPKVQSNGTTTDYDRFLEMVKGQLFEYYGYVFAYEDLERGC